jgi:hypothetical protein
MPGGTLTALGNTSFSQALYGSFTPAASVSGASSTTSTYTINGLVPGDCIDLYPQAVLTTTLVIGSIWCSAANTLSVQWINSTASGSTASPAAIGFIILVTRPSQAYAGYTTYPTAL